MLIERHGGEVPHTHEELQALPGVGRKTANVVMNVAFGEATIAVDTHIFRVGNRTGLAPGKNPLQVELKLLKRVPEEYRLHAHHWLILHGRYTCKARAPECPRCVVNDLCLFKAKTTVVFRSLARTASADPGGSMSPAENALSRAAGPSFCRRNLLPAAGATAQQEVPGAKDFPLIKRYEGSRLIGYDSRPFDTVKLLVGKLNWATTDSPLQTPRGSWKAGTQAALSRAAAAQLARSVPQL